MFIHTAADPTVECMKIPDMALAVAEQFALQDKDVLVLLTDMTNYADAMKEIAITQEQVPSNRGYPGDLYSQLAARYEKAVDFDNSGSVTILAVTTMPGDDVTHPGSGQHRLHYGRPVLFKGRTDRALRFPLPSEAERKRQDEKRPPGADGCHDSSVFFLQRYG